MRKKYLRFCLAGRSEMASRHSSLDSKAKTIDLWVASRSGVCHFFMVVRNRLDKGGEKKDGPRRIDDIETYARHVVTFSLAGIAAVRKAAEGVRGRNEGTTPERGGRT